jgi:hypothetical protein
MELFNLDVAKYVLCFALAFLVNVIVFRKLLFNMFDVWIVLALNQTFSLAYALYAYIQGDIIPNHFWYIIFSYLAFVVGIYAFYGKRNTMPHHQLVVFTPELLRVTIVLVCFYQLLFDVLFFYYRGIPVLAEGGITPAMYHGGFGIVKYIHDSASSLLLILGFKALLVYHRKKLFYFSMIFVLYPMFLMEWGKGAILGLIFTYGLSVYYFSKYYGLNLRINFKKVKYFIPLVVVFMLYKFAIIVASGYEKSISFAILKRLVNSADAMYLYFVRGAYQHLQGQLNIVSYLLSHVSPYFGYVDFLATNLSTLMYEYAFGYAEYGTGYGVSPPLYVIGHAAFGNYGIIYCFLVGLVLSFIKFTRVFKSNYVLFMIIYGLTPSLAGDASLAMYYLSIMIVLSPVIVLSFFMYAAVKKSKAFIIRKFKPAYSSSKAKVAYCR